MRPAPCGYSSAHIFEPILFFLCQKEKNGFNLPRKERGPVPTVVLNLTQKISAISCPSRPSLPPERSLRSAHRLSAEQRHKIGWQVSDRHHQDRVRRCKIPNGQIVTQ